jgi:DNA modification methylase
VGRLKLKGRHRLLCGDSTVREDVDRLMAGEKADMVFTDPPYNHGSEDAGIAASVSQSHRRLMESEWDRSFDLGPALKVFDDEPPVCASAYGLCE